MRLNLMRWALMSVLYFARRYCSGRPAAVLLHTYMYVTPFVCSLFCAGPLPAQTVTPSCTPAAGVVSWWRAENNGLDAVGGQTVIAQASATFGAGKIGQGFNTTGLGDAFHAPGSSIWANQQFTVMAWVKATAATHPDQIGGVIAVKVLNDFPHSPPWNSWIMTYQPANGQFAAQIAPNVSTGLFPEYVSSATGFVSGVFHHVAMTYDGTALSLYVNGVLQGQKLISAAVPYSSNRLGIGGHAWGSTSDRNLIGITDEVQIYNRALSAAEIHAIYAADDCSTLSVTIDIKPNTFPNSINLGSNGTIPVAILGTATFSVSTVDPLTITLAGAAVRLKGKGTPSFTIEDINGDGISDMLVHVVTEALQLSATDTEAVLEGQTTGGKKIKGKDVIRVVP